jgi:hypothetical protein
MGRIFAQTAAEARDGGRKGEWVTIGGILSAKEIRKNERFFTFCAVASGRLARLSKARRLIPGAVSEKEFER